MDWERKMVIKSDIDPLVMPVALAFQWLVQIGAKGYFVLGDCPSLLYGPFCEHVIIGCGISSRQ